MVCFHSVGFGGHAQDSQYELVSQDSAQELFHRTISPYLGVSRIAFQLCCPRTRCEIKENVVLQNPQEHADRLPPPRTLILDFTLTHTRYGSSHVHTTGQLTNTSRSHDAPDLDGTVREVTRKKILHYRQLYINRRDPIAFLPAVVDTTGQLYDDLSRLLFLHTRREVSALANEIPEESDQFRFLRAV